MSPAPAGGPAARLPALLLALALVAVAALGLASLDVGYHWDESAMIRSVQRSLDVGLMLPGWYNYPSLTYDVTLLTALPRAIPDAVRHSTLAEPHTGSPELLRFLGTPKFDLEVRGVCFVLCMLAGWPVFLLARRLAGAWAALFAALALLLSWELFYHAHWIAPDGLVMSAVAFALWAQHHVLSEEDAAARRRWIVRAACFAGLATSAKYPGAIALFTLLVAIALARRSGSAAARDVFRESALGLVVTLGVFAFTSPGCWLEPAAFVQDVAREVAHYRFGHGEQTVAAGWDHFSRLAAYLGTVLLSRQPLLAAGAAALAIVGAVDLARARGRTAVWLLALPLPFIAYMSMQRVMLVRNDLLLLPTIATLTGLGLAALARAAAGRAPLRVAVTAAATGLVAVNAAGIAHSGWRIASPSHEMPKPRLEQRLRSTPGIRYALSPVVRRLLDQPPAFHPANVVGVPESADRYVFMSGELTGFQPFGANRRGRYRTLWSMKDEVNWDYYPDWEGGQRMLEISARDVKP